MTRSGRRPGTPTTRETILDAARTAFSARGYSATSIRQIAGAAEVDPALVMHYFGSKRRLFVAATGLPEEISGVLDELTAGPVERLGERLAGLYLSLLDQPGSPLVALARSAASDEEAASTVREFLVEEVIARLAVAVGTPDAALRGALVGSQLVGVAMARHIVGVEPLRSADAESVIAWIGPTLQRYLTGAGPGQR